MPSWLPGDDYMTNFKVGDPYVRIDDGYARLPGAGYEALHPELKGVNPEDYPDIHKLRILSDVAPYSREYNLFRQRVASQARNNTGLQIELDKIIDRVRQVKESSVLMDERHFTGPVDTIEGTVDQAGPTGITLKEYPGRVFRFSSVGTSAADLSAQVLGENKPGVSVLPATKELARPRGGTGRHLPSYYPLPADDSSRIMWIMKVLGNAILLAGVPLIIGGLLAVSVLFLGVAFMVLANRTWRFVRA
jgi:hypothetical protein